MSAKAVSVGAPALPQVNLLPPEVKAARGLAKVKQWLAVVVILSLVLSAGLVFIAILEQEAADRELALVQERTAELEAEQQRYAEVPLVLAALDRARNAREVGMSTEIRWMPYYSAIAATAPPGVSIESIKVQSATPMVSAIGPTDALSALGISVITFSAQSSTVPDTEAWLRALEQVPGFSDPWFSQATLNEAGDVVAYNVAAAVIVVDDARLRRFSAEQDAAEQEEAAQDEAEQDEEA